MTGSVIGLAVITILALLNKDKSLGVNLLMLLLACLISILFANIAYQTDFFIKFPHLYRTFAFTSFCIGPLSYLYVRSTIEQSYELKWADALFFLPALGYAIHRVPFMFLPTEEKILIISRSLENSTPIMAEPEGMLPEGFAAILRILTGVLFLFAQFIMLFKYRSRFKNALSPISQEVIFENQRRYQWLITFSLILSSGYLLALGSTILQLSQNKFYGNYTTLSVSLTVLSISVVLFAKPRLLYGMSGWFNDQEHPFASKVIEPTTLPFQEITAPRAGSFSAQQRLQINSSLTSFLQSSEEWLKPGFGIRDLSKAVQLPLYQLSAFINQEFNKNFNEWLNDSRIDRFTGLLETDSKVRTYTIQHIGESLGFRSRTSFIAAVKRRTGKTPSEIMGINPGMNDHAA